MILTNNQYSDWVTTLLPWIIVSLFIPALIAQDLPDICNGQGYLSQRQTGSDRTNLYRVDIGADNVSLDLLEQYGDYFNGIGYDAATESFYGTVQGSKEIVRVQLDGTMETVFTENSVGSWDALAGDCNFNGQYITYQKTNGYAYVYNIDPFSRQDSFRLDWHSSTGITNDDPVVFADIVFDPENPQTVYAYHGRNPATGGPEESRGWLIKFNIDPSHPDFGLMKQVMEIPDGSVYGLGALFFGADLGLYLYGREDNTSGNEDLIRLDLESGDTRLVSHGPTATNVDGCSCLSGLKVTKTIETNPVPCGEDIFFDFEVYWYGRDTIEDVELTDTVRFGEEVEIVSAPEWNDGTVTTISEGKVISLQKADMLKGDTVHARIKISGANVGSYCNQAFVGGQYDGRSVRQPSDDPDRDGWLDQTCLRVDGFGDITEEVNSQVVPSCAGQANGTITLNWEGFETGQNYILIPFQDTITAGEGQLTWTDLSAGSYSLDEIAQPGDTCDFAAILNIEVPTWSELQDVPDTSVCRMEDFTLSPSEDFISIDRWRPLGQAVWNDPPLRILAFGVEDAGAYEVEYSAEECLWRDTFQVELGAVPFADYVRSYTGIPDESIQIQADSLSQDITSWMWSPEEGLDCTDCPEPVASDEDNEQYVVEVVGENGCTDTVEIRINWIDNQGIYIPNVFSPNSDGINDIFTVFPTEWVTDFIESEIFNRWGDRVYHNMGKPRWDGRFNGKYVTNGVYVLVIKYRSRDGRVRLFAGDITVAR